MINLRLLQHFVAVLECGSFLEAARRMSISQPALSKSIGALENYYRVKLFERTPRGVRATAFAQALEPHARRTLWDLKLSRDEMVAIASGTEGLIAVGAGSSFVSVICAAVEEMGEAHANVEFKVITDHATGLRRALLNNRIDFYVGLANNEIGESAFDVELIYADEYVGICAEDHPFTGKVVSPRDLRACEWIMPDLEEPARVALEAFLVVEQEPSPKIKFTTNADLILRRFLSGGRYVSMMPRTNTFLPEFPTFGRFTIDGFHFERQVGIVQRTKLVTTPLQDRFKEILAKKVRELGRTSQA